MGAIASQITSLTIVYSTFYSDADQRKHQSSASPAFVRGIHRGPVNSPHKWPVTRKMFPFDDVIMLPVKSRVNSANSSHWTSPVRVDHHRATEYHSRRPERCRTLILVHRPWARHYSVWNIRHATAWRHCIFSHDDVIKWKLFPCYWPFVRGIHRSPVNSPHKGQWPRALMFSLIWAWIKGWLNNREVGDLRHYRGHYDVNVLWRVKIQVAWYRWTSSGA